MKKTRNLLMTLFAGFLALAGLLYVAGEFLHYDYSFLAHTSRQTQFICSTVMILLTISLVPLSLRLFKFRRINADLLQRKADALAFWGSLRMVSLGLLLVVNTFLYFAFGFDSTYGYLAVVILLTMPFVLPTLSRCEAEVAPLPTPEEALPAEEQAAEETHEGESEA